MPTISELKKDRNESDLSKVAAYLSFEGELLCNETHVHVYPAGRESFSVKWADGFFVGRNGYFYETGTDHKKTAQAIREVVG